MKIVLTNDDGIDAPGLQSLYDSVVRAFGPNHEVVVVAPNRNHSECGHSVTSMGPLKVESPRPGWHSLEGTPVDCVRGALAWFAPKPDMVLSGVNNGANLGVNLLVSGTFAAAREAAFSGVPALALSHYRHPDIDRSWDHVPEWLEQTLVDFRQAAMRRSAGVPCLWNVNLPAIDPASPPPSQVRCDVDSLPFERTAKLEGSELKFRANFQNRPKRPGFDVDLCFSGRITISELAPKVV